MGSRRETTTIPVIDLFAGPGGLGEGFSSLLTDDGERMFKIGLSIEKDRFAHQTLELRAFFRNFPHGQVPTDYYNYLRGSTTRDDLYDAHPEEAKAASVEAWYAELGSKQTPDSLIDTRIRDALGNAKDWVLIGGPPCQAYSLAGRSRVIGASGRELYEADPKHKLYKHYLRIISVHRPPVFIMENVKGLLSASVREVKTLDEILNDLRNPPKASGNEESDPLEYRLFPLTSENSLFEDLGDPRDFLIRAENHGIPQTRHRVIIVGIRSDHQVSPRRLNSKRKISINQVISDLPVLRSKLSKQPDDPKGWKDAIRSMVFSDWIHSKDVDLDVRESIREITRNLSEELNTGGRFVPITRTIKCLQNWYSDPQLQGVCNHETRGHIVADLHRYLFAAVFTSIKGHSPKLQDFPDDLLPRHRNVSKGNSNQKFSDRFRVQVNGSPATTVVSHISKDGHYFIHYDPSQCRSLTVREAARIQTFPDNYFFEGPRTEQYQQVGNAVPPLLARDIASSVASVFGRT